MQSFARLAVIPALAAVYFLSAAPAPAQKKEDKLTFEIYKDKAGEFRWRLKTAGGDIIAVPESAYTSHANVKSAIESIRKHADKLKAEVYQDKGKEFRWRLKATNGQVMARASDGHKDKAAAEKAVETLRAGAKDAAVIDKK